MPSIDSEQVESALAAFRPDYGFGVTDGDWPVGAVLNGATRRSSFLGPI